MRENKDKQEYLKLYRALDRRSKEIAGHIKSHEQQEQKKMLEKKLECEIKKAEIIAAIHRIGDTEEEEVLELRYIKGQSWQHICTQMHYGETKVFRIHREALKKIKICNQR